MILRWLPISFSPSLSFSSSPHSFSFSLSLQLGWEQLHQQWVEWRLRQSQLWRVQRWLLSQLAAHHTHWLPPKLRYCGESSLVSLSTQNAHYFTGTLVVVFVALDDTAAECYIKGVILFSGSAKHVCTVCLCVCLCVSSVFRHLTRDQWLPDQTWHKTANGMSEWETERSLCELSLLRLMRSIFIWDLLCVVLHGLKCAVAKDLATECWTNKHTHIHIM